MFIEERHEEILKIVNNDERVSIRDIQKRFNVSLDSARRDLRILEEKGLLRRTHGGAIPLNQDVLSSKKRNIKNFEGHENYNEISKTAAFEIKENDVVYLTNSSFGFLMLQYLPKDMRYTLVLNSPTLADELKYWQNINVYLIGGKMKMVSNTSIIDSLATEFVKNMNFDISFITGGGFDSQFGLTQGTDEAASFQRSIIANTKKNVLLIPSQKIGKKTFVKVCDADAFDLLITDWNTMIDEISKIKEKGLDVIIAQKP